MKCQCHKYWYSKFQTTKTVSSFFFSLTVWICLQVWLKKQYNCRRSNILKILFFWNIATAPKMTLNTIRSIAIHICCSRTPNYTSHSVFLHKLSHFWTTGHFEKSTLNSLGHYKVEDTHVLVVCLSTKFRSVSHCNQPFLINRTFIHSSITRHWG